MVLQSIRERLTGILAFAILGILIIPFALVGVNEYFTSNTGNLVARVNDAEISVNEFNQSFSDYRRRMQSILGLHAAAFGWSHSIYMGEYSSPMSPMMTCEGSRYDRRFSNTGLLCEYGKVYYDWSQGHRSKTSRKNRLGVKDGIFS